MGYVHYEDLVKEIQEKTHIDKRVAQVLAEEIQTKIITPMLSYEGGMQEVKLRNPEPQAPTPTRQQPDGSDLLTPAFKPKRPSAPEPAASPPEATPAPPPPPQPEIPATPPPQQETVAPPTPALPQQPSTTNVPKFKRPQEPPVTAPSPHEPQATETPPSDPPSAAAPFVIHEETKLQPLASGDRAPLSRPSFFKSTAGDKSKEQATTARLEIGQEPQETGTPEIGRTEKEGIRVVNYEGPVTTADPFARHEPNKQKPSEEEKQGKQKEVSPDNIVNLKDLPK